MKAKELKQLNRDQLLEKKKGLKSSMFKTRFQFYAGEEVNSSAVRVIRKDIARINTILNEKTRMENS